MRILVINPNTSETVTERIRSMAQAVAGCEADIVTATATFGDSYIASRAGAAIAAHAVLDAAAYALLKFGRPDAIVIGCFGDPGLEALRELTDVPVTGFAEAGFLEAAASEGPFAVVVVGLAWGPMLHELSQRVGVDERIARIDTLDADLSDYSVKAMTGVFNDAVEKTVADTGARRVVTGGAGLIPVLHALSGSWKVPVIDSNAAAIRRALALARDVGREKPQSAAATRMPVGLSPPLMALLAGSPELPHSDDGKTVGMERSAR